MARGRIAYEYLRGEFDEAMALLYQPIASAGTAAIREAADDAKAGGRASIAAAGFSRKWQNTLRAEVYPRKGESADAAAVISHRIGYAGVFEEGATITGKPLLWLPMQGVAAKLRSRKTTPALFRKMVGPLQVAKSRTGRPLLLAWLKITPAASRRGPPYKITMNALRRGAQGDKPRVRVPVFASVAMVRIGKKFDVTRSVERAAARLPELYLKNLDPGN